MTNATHHTPHTNNTFIIAPPAGRGLVFAGQHEVIEDMGFYMYDELRYGGVPKPEAAARILRDLRAGRAMPHPISEPGYEQRLEDIMAGRCVDPIHFKARDEVAPVRSIINAEPARRRWLDFLLRRSG